MTQSVFETASLWFPAGLTGDQALDRRDGHARHAFDVTSSDAKGLNRSVPDTRPAGCVFVCGWVCVCVGV